MYELTIVPYFSQMLFMIYKSMVADVIGGNPKNKIGRNGL